MKTLYISDLDGTLLRTDKTISPFTAEVINKLSADGVLFSYATARSIYTAAELTAPITATLPVVTYNGGVLLHSKSGAILQANYFSQEEAEEILDLFLSHGLYPLCYAYIDGRERLSYDPDRLSEVALRFLDDRPGDERLRPVVSPEQLGDGELLYFNCIHSREKLEALYTHLRPRFSCMLQEDLYTGGFMLEVMPRQTSKAQGILQLKKLLGCDRVVAFGDGINDIPMFEAADAGYAVENAVPELKAIATGVIQSNDSDGVAKWLLENA